MVTKYVDYALVKNEKNLIIGFQNSKCHTLEHRFITICDHSFPAEKQ